MELWAWAGLKAQPGSLGGAAAEVCWNLSQLEKVKDLLQLENEFKDNWENSHLF